MMRLLTLLLILFCSPVIAAEPVKIGFIYSYSGLPNEMVRARNAAELAVNEFNESQDRYEAELIVRDDRGNAGDGIQIAQDLIYREQVDILLGTSFTTVAKAIYELANKEKIPYFSAWCSSDVCLKTDDSYTFSFEESYNVTAASLAKHAAQYDVKNWAIVASNGVWEHTLAKGFKETVLDKNPEARFVAELFNPIGQINGAAVVRTLRTKNVEGAFIVLSGNDLAEYIRAAQSIGLLDELKHVHPYLAPERLEFLKDEIPVGWYTSGYPTPSQFIENEGEFFTAYQNKYNQDAGTIGALSYTSAKMALEALRAAKTTDAKDIRDATLGLKDIETPFGKTYINPETYRSNTEFWSGYLTVDDSGAPSLNNASKNGVE